MKTLAVLTSVGLTEEQVALLRGVFESARFWSDTRTEDVAIARACGAHVVMYDYMVLPLGDRFVAACPGLELLILDTTTTGGLDTARLRDRGVKLAPLLDFATRDVAEVGVNMVMSLNSKMAFAQQIVQPEPFKYGAYEHTHAVFDICPGHPVLPLIVRRQLKTLTVGIIGLGSIGLEAAAMFHALGLRVIAYNRSKKSVSGIEMVPLRRLFREADVLFVSLKYDYTDAMRAFVSADLLRGAKDGALLVSVAHPDLFDMEYLIDNHAKFSGIGLDFAVTPDVQRLLAVRKHDIIVTPFLGSQSVQAYSNMTDALVDTAVRYAEGKPIHVVN